MSEFKSIKTWSVEDRPREKMAQRGAAALSAAELLAILINTGTAKRSALDIAKEIMQLNGNNLHELSKMTLSDFKKIKGLGEKKAITLLAAMEIGKRRQLSAALERPRILSSNDAFDILVSHYTGKTVEAFYVLFLNASSKLVSIENTSIGGITGTVADLRVIFKAALEYKSVTKIIISHNHPSGNLNPSEADRKLTEKIQQAGRLIDIDLMDHIIVGGNSFFSFRDEGLL